MSGKGKEPGECICGHPASRHSPNLGFDNGCSFAIIDCGCQHFIDAACICGEINARHCPVHNEPAVESPGQGDADVIVSYYEGRVCQTCDRIRAGTPSDGMILNRESLVWHWGLDYGVTSCGKDATRGHWWWPL